MAKSWRHGSAAFLAGGAAIEAFAHTDVAVALVFIVLGLYAPAFMSSVESRWPSLRADAALELALPFLLTPVILLVLPAAVGRVGGVAGRVAIAGIGILLVTGVAAIIWRGLPARRRGATVALTAGILAALAVGELLPNRRGEHPLFYLRLFVLTAFFLWYVGLSAWLILRLVEAAATRPLRSVARTVTATFFVTAAIPAALFFGLPVLFGGLRIGILDVLFLAPGLIATVAVVPIGLAIVLAGVALFSISLGWTFFVMTGLVVAAGLIIRKKLAITTAPPGDSRHAAGAVLEQPIAMIARVTLLLGGAVAATGIFIAAVGYAPIGTDAVHVDSRQLPVPRDFADLQQSFSPAVYISTGDHPPHTVCAYVNPDNPTLRALPTGPGCEAMTPNSRPTVRRSVKDGLEPLTYAVVVPVTRASVPVCSGDPSLLCPAALGTALVLEYWLFYDFDEWAPQATVVGKFTQKHDADWEVVAVGFRRGHDTFVPAWSAYSSHCGGSWLPWSATPRAGNHLEDWVARGSHANYPSDRVRSPNWASCMNPAWIDGFVDVASFAASIREGMPPKNAAQVPLTAVLANDDREFLRNLQPLGRGQTFSLLGWHTVVAQTAGVNRAAKNVGIRSPLDGKRLISKDPVTAIFGPRTLWGCHAPRSACRLPR